MRKIKKWINDHPQFVMGVTVGGLGVVLGILTSREMGEAFENARAKNTSNEPTLLSVVPVPKGEDPADEFVVRQFRQTPDGRLQVREIIFDENRKQD